MLLFKSCLCVISPRFFFQFQNPSNSVNSVPTLSLSLPLLTEQGRVASLISTSMILVMIEYQLHDMFWTKDIFGVSRQSRMRLDIEIWKRWWIYFVLETFVCLTISSHPPMDPDILSCGRYLPAHPSETSNKLHSCSRGGSTSNESQKSKRGNFLLISWDNWKHIWQCFSAGRLIGEKKLATELLNLACMQCPTNSQNRGKYF